VLIMGIASSWHWCLSRTTIPPYRQGIVKALLSGRRARWNEHGGTSMVEIRVIGELRLAGAAAELPSSRRARALLGWLAVHPGRHHRSRLAGLFWPDVLEASARASLRSAIWALRPALGAGLSTSRDTLMLDGSLLVDLWQFRRLLAAGEQEAAVALCSGELLQDLDDDWVIEARAEFEDDIAAALITLTEQAAEPAAALTWARRLAAARPLDETAGALLIRACLAAGDTTAALDAFAGLRLRLGTALGIAVSEATAALIEPLTADRGWPEPVWSGHAIQPPPGLVGRNHEFAALAAAWESARSGTGTAVVLTGEGGIGKTRLLEELRARSGTSTAVIAGTVLAGTPFAIWTEALSDLLALTGQPSQAWVTDLARIVPALGYGRGLAPAVDPQLDRVRICEAVVQFLGWAARRTPVLVGLEDLHLADGASLDLIAYAGRRLARLPVLFVLTRRQLPARQHLDAVLAALRSRHALAADITLEPLADDQLRALIVTAAGPVKDTTISQVIEFAGGNPLLAIEAATAARAGPVDAGTGLAGAGLAGTVLVGTGLAGAGLVGAVRLAVGKLSVPGRMFAEFVAAAGRDLDRAEIAALPLPNPAREAAEALGSGLLISAEGRVGYRHALLRDAVYQTIPEPVRARLHAELARMLRGRAGSRAAEVARHFCLAGQDEQAVGLLALAARDARRVAAMDAAAGFLTEALRIEPGDTELLVELAEIEAFRGSLSASDHAFHRALELIAPLDSGALTSAWLRRGRWLRGGICHPRQSRASYQNALDVLDRDPDTPARAEALAGLAWAEAVAGDLALVDELLAGADQVLGDSPSDLLVHDIGVARGHALIRAGRFAESFGPLIAASAAAGRAGRPDMAYSCLSNAASAAACAGEFGRALDFADRCLPLVIPNGLLRLSVYAQTARSAILRRLDRLAEAEQACDEAGVFADRIGLPDLDGLVHAERGLVRLASSAPASAAAELAIALDLGAPVSKAGIRLRLAEALTLAGRLEQAAAELRNVTLEPVGPADFPATLVARMSRVQGLIASRRGETRLAEQRLAESAGAWQRIVETLDKRQAGAGYVASLIDLGRPPLTSLIEPAAELAIVHADLAVVRST
jgi:DNA-binding SARP family transcriptional activator/tetratricopeptide (TPR) repeat protein